VVRRVLVVNKYHFVSSGADRYFLSILEALRKRGIEAVPLSVDYPQTLPTPYRRHFVPPVGAGDGARIREQRPGPGEQLALAGRALWSRAAARAVAQIAREGRPDVAYLLNVNNHLSPSVVAACHRLGIPVVMRLSDFHLGCPANMYYRAGAPCTDCKRGLHHAVLHRCVHGSLARSALGAFALALHRRLRVYEKVAAFVAPTRFMARELRELGLPPARIHALETFAELQPETPSDGADPHVLFVGRFAEYKGPDLAIEAFARIAPAAPLALHLLGDEGDADSARLRALAARHPAARIVFRPFALLPSRFYENLPNAALESFACGRAVVATRLGSLPELVRDGGNGLLFEPGDVAGFASCIERLAGDPAARARMGAGARESVRRDHSEERHCERLLALFEAVARRAPAPAALPAPDAA
jgi:glycosyltransferase involved in cell wall biosynthesis